MRRRILFTYDIEDVPKYGSANNRLMFYTTYNTSGGAPTLESTTYYYYNDLGNVTRVVTDKENTDPEEPQFDSTSLVYAKNGRAVRYVLGESWDQTPLQTCQVHYAREFRYDGPRQRYLNRVLDLATLGPAPQASDETWSDYDGDNIYGDFRLTAGQWTQMADYEPGVARSYVPGDSLATTYYHQDLLGSTRMVTSSVHGVSDKQWYSAFGESGTSETMRYGFAGAHGYQQDPTSDAFPFMHVGARYYDAATGRFLQRDPIGISGGLNVYGYVGSSPTTGVDPNGQFAVTVPVLIGAGIAFILGTPKAAEAPAPFDDPLTMRDRHDDHENDGIGLALIIICGPISNAIGGLFGPNIKFIRRFLP